MSTDDPQNGHRDPPSESATSTTDWPDSIWSEWDQGWSDIPAPSLPNIAHDADDDSENRASPRSRTTQQQTTGHEPIQSEPTNHLEHRLQQLLEEAEQSDQRIAVLEDLLLAADSSQRAQEEERLFLESWLESLEHRFSLKEQEHEAEIETLERTIASQKEDISDLHRRLSEPVGDSGVEAEQYLQETLTRHQQANEDLAAQLAAMERRCRELEHQFANVDMDQSEDVRIERAELAQQRAELARQRHDLVTELAQVSVLPKSSNSADTEMSCRIKAFREHLREIHVQEQHERAENSLVTRLSNLWHRVSN